MTLACLSLQETEDTLKAMETVETHLFISGPVTPTQQYKHTVVKLIVYPRQGSNKHLAMTLSCLLFFLETNKLRETQLSVINSQQ